MDETGAFCFAAYTILDGDCGEYKASVDGKHDNYRVDGEDNFIPEFGVVGASIMLGAAGLFVMSKRKN